MEQYIQISKINDYLYSPNSLYLHSIYENFSRKTYNSKFQVAGLNNHKNIDEQKYSTLKNILTGIYVYSDKYQILGKIDIYNKKTGELIERKTRIKTIHKGYIYQLYAQYFCLLEMGFKPKKLLLHCLLENKRYEIKLPNKKDEKEFSDLISEIKNFNPEKLLENHSDYFADISIYNPLSW